MNVFLLILLTLFGHAFFWVGLGNRIHGIGVRRWCIVVAADAMALLAAAIPPVVALAYWGNYQRLFEIVRFPVGCTLGQRLLAGYIILCWVVVPVTLVWFLVVRYQTRMPSLVRFHGRRRAAIDPHSDRFGKAEATHHVLTRLPWNEMLRLDVVDWTLDAPRLPSALDGLSIVHLSDTHLIGVVGKAYFREVVRVANEQSPDLMVLTGDIVDSPDCLDWIPDTLGRLRAKYGVYFILGNHDLRLGDAAQLRGLLEGCGLIDLGGRQRRIEINGCPILLTGNELPWFDPAQAAVDKNGSAAKNGVEDGERKVEKAASGGERPFHIVLSHTPDQFAWARSHDADLLAVGHTHGGQVRIPPLGAIFSPSFWGVKYIAGIFYSPPTIMHVTRGVSSNVPLRWLCPPEIAKLILRSTLSDK
jgi:uncharacterized protein